MNTLKFQLVTPERTVLREEVDSITCTTTKGQITILPNHVPLVAELAADELIVRVRGEARVLHAGGGFLRVEPGSSVVVLSDAAEHAADIDAARAEEALVRAQKRMQEAALSDREYALTSALIERNSARLKIVKKYSRRGRVPITSEGVLEE